MSFVGLVGETGLLKLNIDRMHQNSSSIELTNDFKFEELKTNLMSLVIFI